MVNRLLPRVIAIAIVATSLGCQSSPKKFSPGIDGAIIITKGRPTRYELSDGDHIITRSGGAIRSACAVRGDDLIGATGDRTAIFQRLAFSVPIVRLEENERTNSWRLVGLSPEALWDGNEITTPTGSKIRLDKPGTYTIDCTVGAPDTLAEAFVAIGSGKQCEWKLAAFSTTPYDWKSVENK